MNGFPFALDHPAMALLLFSGCFALTWAIASRSRAEGGRARKRVSLALRSLLLALLVLALCGLQWRRERDEMTTVFAVDWSDSTRGAPREAAREWVLAAAAAKRPQDRLAVVQFGRDALIEEGVREDLDELALASTPRPDGSDLAAALRLARGLLPAEGLRRVVVLTDGSVDGEDPAGALRDAREAGVDVLLVPLAAERGPETLVEEVVAPERVHEGEPFEVKVVVRGSVAAEGTLSVTRDGELIGQEQLVVEPGRPSVLRFIERHSAAGSHLYRAHFDAEPDAFSQNDAAEALVRVEGQPSLLVIDPVPEDLAPARALLESAGMAVRVGGLDLVPTSLAEAARHEAILLSNVESLDLSVRQMKVLRAYARESGGGLMMIGGPASFGPGGWYRTPVEEALPVDMDVRNEKFYPSLALITSLDKSGSMAGRAGASKMDLAKEAAALAVDLLHPRDRAGVIVFDGAAKWVVPPTNAIDKQAIRARIGTIRAGGGTDVYTGLQLAKTAFEKERTVLKHLIVLSDGMTAPRDFEGMCADLTAMKVTVSTVAVGSDADLFTMQRIAEWGKGRYYFTDDPASIPRIFTKEAFTTARSFVVEEPFVPRVVVPHPVLRGSGGALPALDGYVASTAKADAEVVLQSHREEPVLAFRRFGLGRTGALTTDLGQRWSASWLSSDPARTVLAQSVRWLSRRADSERLQVTMERREGDLLVAVEARAEDGSFLNFAEIQARLVAPDLSPRELALRQVAPGRYEGRVPEATPGAWFAGIAQESDGKIVRGATAARVFPYSDEYRLLDSGDAVARLASASGARVTPGPEASFVPTGERAVSLRPAWRELLLAAAFLLLFDVGLRRVMLPAGWAGSLAAAIARRLAKRSERASSEGLARLRDVKDRTRATTRRDEATDELPSRRQLPRKDEAPARVEAPPPAARPDEPGPAPQDEPPEPPAPEGGGFSSRLLAAKKRARRDGR
jgi:Mg-chelatase subunit ChlD